MVSPKQNNFHQPDPTLQGNGDGNEAAEVGAGTGDMTKAVYDANDDGRVDSADFAEHSATSDGLVTPAGFFLYYGRDEAGNLGFHRLPGSFENVAAFLDLSDTPASYSGEAGKVPAVNGTEDGIEFISVGAGSSQQLTSKTTAGTGTLPDWAYWKADSSGGALSRAMPTSPTDGMEVTVHDDTDSAATNNITVTVTGPTTINEPTLNLDGQTKKWRYDASGDQWDLVFSKAVTGGGGGVTWNSIALVNPGAETGDTSGWTVTTGGMAVRTANPTPNTGSYYFTGGTSANTEVYQEFALSAFATQAEIDAGELFVRLEWYQTSFSGADDGRCIIRFLDASNVVLGEIENLNTAVNATQTWEKRHCAGRAPVDSTKVRIIMRMERDSGTANDAYFDDLVAEYALIA